MQGQPDFLSAEKLQLFIAGLAGLPQDEVRKAKVLYLRNAISEYRAALESMRASGCVLAAFAVIPLFWPFLITSRRTFRAQQRLFRERILNAVEVWREDLGDEAARIEEEVFGVENEAP